MTELNPILRARVRAQTSDQPVAEASVANTTGENAPATTTRKRRIPMSVARRKMEVEALPGYHLHWFSEDQRSPSHRRWLRICL